MFKKHQNLDTFSGHVDCLGKVCDPGHSALLESVRDLAKAEGRQIQAVVEDALRQHLETKKNTSGRGREHLMAAYLETTDRFSGLYERIAK